MASAQNSGELDSQQRDSIIAQDPESTARQHDEAIGDSVFDAPATAHEQAADAYDKRDQSADQSTLSESELSERAVTPGLAPMPTGADDEYTSDVDAEDTDDDSAVDVSLKGKRVLLIEDDREFAAGITEYLNELGITEVVHASNAEAGLSYLTDKETFPHVILLELALIGMDGIQFLAQLRANQSKRLQNLPAVVITMLDSPSIYRRAAHQKVGAFLRKPVAITALRNGLQAALRGDIVEKPFSQPKSWLDEVDEEELRAKREANIAKASAKAQKQGFLVRLLNALIPWSGKA